MGGKISASDAEELLGRSALCELVALEGLLQNGVLKKDDSAWERLRDNGDSKNDKTVLFGVTDAEAIKRTQISMRSRGGRRAFLGGGVLNGLFSRGSNQTVDLGSER